MENEVLWIWLSLTFRPGSRAFAGLWRTFHDVRAIYNAGENEISELSFIREEAKERFLDKDLSRAEEISAYCRENGVGIVTMEDEAYPKAFHALYNPPALIYYRGTLPDWDNTFSAAVVGTRNMTYYGMSAAHYLTTQLTTGGALTVSGMAIGIDSTVAKAAIAAGGKTYAVLGSGINVVYPRCNEDLMEEIVKNGAVLTEYPPDSKPLANHFPTRNRLIAALANCCVVVEAPQKSGALITANIANTIGKDLYVVPGPIRAFQSMGTNYLLKLGVPAVTSGKDVIRNYVPYYPQQLNEEGAAAEPRSDPAMQVPFSPERPKLFDLIRGTRKVLSQKKREELEGEAPAYDTERESDGEIGSVDDVTADVPSSFDESQLGETERKVYALMPVNRPMTADELTKAGVDVSEVAQALTMLEIYGAIEAAPGGTYVRK